MPISLRFAARSNVGLGSKDRNEDSGYASSTMLILADGMGGHAAGDVASSTVVGVVSPLGGDEIGADDALDQLADHIRAANERLRSEMDADPSREGMGTNTKMQQGRVSNGRIKAACFIESQNILGGRQASPRDKDRRTGGERWKNR